MTDTVFEKIRQKEKKNRKNAIVEIAEDILKTEGLESVTVRNVAQRAGLSSGAIYMYFKNKEELLLSMMIQNLKILKDDMAESMDNSNPVEAIKKMGYHYKNYFSRFGKYINILGFTVKDEDKFRNLDSYMLDELEHVLGNLLSLVREMLAAAPMDGLLKGLPPERGVPVLWALIQGLVQITLPAPRSEATHFDFDQVMEDVTHILA